MWQNVKVRFYNHKIGNEDSDHCAYTFYVIGDSHIGDCDPEDYGVEGHQGPLDLFTCEGLPDAGTGSNPGKGLGAAVWAVNKDYKLRYQVGMESGEAVFAVHIGDLAVRGERAELEHAKVKLDSLIMPWLPVVGNHDTWPVAEEGDYWEQDWFFTEVFGPHIDKHQYIFPEWKRRPAYVSTITPQIWGFSMGPNQHWGLDFSIRSVGGINTFAATNEGWFWFKNNCPTNNTYDRMMIAAHHPLNITQFPGYLSEVRSNIKDRSVKSPYWFAGHTHPKENNKFNSDGVKVHVTSSVSALPGDGEIHVALVKVYSDLVCDFTLSDDTVQVDETVGFTDNSACYGSSIDAGNHHWDFGDGTSGSGYSTSHAYNMPGVYWVKHRVKQSGSSKYAWMIRRVVVQDPPGQRTFRLVGYWVPMGTGTPDGPVGWGEHKYWMHLDWWFDRKDWEPEDQYRLYRWGPYDRLYSGDPYIWYTWDPGHFYCFRHAYSFHPGTYMWQIDERHYFDSGVMKVGPQHHLPYYSPGDTGTWYVSLAISRGNHIQAQCSDTLVKIAPPYEGGGCPEVYTYYSSYYDSVTQQTTHMHIANNTILPHSEILEYAGQVLTDRLKLEGFYDEADHYYLNILENDNETSYINEAKLWVVDHPTGTGVVTSSDSNIYVYSEISTPLFCQDNLGTNCYDEIVYQDDTAYLGNNSSYLTVTFPNNYWPSKGLVVGTGIYAIEGAEVAPMPKNYLSIPNKPDGGGGWIPLGEAFARKRPSMWLFDVSDVVDNTFRIDCSGDSCYINYVGLVKLEPEGWTKTEAPLDSAILWIVDPPGTAPVGSNVEDLISDPQTAGMISPCGQLALSFTEVPPDTTCQRDFVLQTSGYYIPGIGGGDGGEQSTTPSLRFDLEVQTLHGLRKAMLINYEVPVATDVKIAIVDVAGRVVAEPLKEEVAPGRHQLEWNLRDDAGRKVASGVYFVKMVAGEFTEVNKVVLMK